LLARGDEVIAYQRSANAQLETLGASVVTASVTDSTRLNDTLRGSNAVIHTAGKAGAWGSRDDYFNTNISGTQNVIAACRKNTVDKLVFTSSPSVVHAGGDIEGGDESLPYAQHFGAHYPASKALAEQAVMAADGPSLHTVSLRPHLIWGPGDNHLLPRLLQRAKSGHLKLPGPNKLIDTVYVENAARAHLLALDKLGTNPEVVGAKTYFISNDEPRSQGDVITGLLNAAGIEVDIQAISPALAVTAGAVMETTWRLLGLKTEPPITRWSANQLATAHWFDISAAKQDLGYNAEVSIDEGLKLLADSLRG